MEKSNCFYEKRIPQINTLEMFEEHDFIDSPFVELPHIVKMDGVNKMIIDMQYPKLGMENALDRCLIRKEALERLLIACTYLPQGLSFKIWDIYRTWSLQNELYDVYKSDIIRQFDLESMSVEQQEKIISNYVSLPSKDEMLPPLHTTGGSVDLTITNLMTGNDLDFGINFDDFSDLTNTVSFEKYLSDEIVRDNRRLLYNTMIQAGFTNLPSEVWHYDYGNRAWGYYKQKPAIYKGIFDVDKIQSIMSFEEFMTELKNDNSEISVEIIKHQWDSLD